MSGIDRCTCFDVTFDRLKAWAERNRCGFEGIQQRFGCGRGCGLCRPYVLEMLRTGRTRFSPDEPVPGTRADETDPEPQAGLLPPVSRRT